MSVVKTELLIYIKIDKLPNIRIISYWIDDQMFSSLLKT